MPPLQHPDNILLRICVGSCTSPAWGSKWQPSDAERRRRGGRELVYGAGALSRPDAGGSPRRGGGPEAVRAWARQTGSARWDIPATQEQRRSCLELADEEEGYRSWRRGEGSPVNLGECDRMGDAVGAHMKMAARSGDHEDL